MAINPPMTNKGVTPNNALAPAMGLYRLLTPLLDLYPFLAIGTTILWMLLLNTGRFLLQFHDRESGIGAVRHQRKISSFMHLSSVYSRCAILNPTASTVDTAAATRPSKGALLDNAVNAVPLANSGPIMPIAPAVRIPIH